MFHHLFKCNNWKETKVTNSVEMTMKKYVMQEETTSSVDNDNTAVKVLSHNVHGNVLQLST